jgi:hypothetical protein
MGTTTPKGFPYPFGIDGNNVPADLLALAARIDAVLSARTYTEIAALSGADLWDGRVVFQSDTGVLRPFTGLYAYKAAAGIWQALLPTSAATYTPLDLTVASPPTLGTASVNTGKWSRFGPHVLAQFVITCGSSGYVNGNWSMVVPAPFKDRNLLSPTGETVVGAAVAFDASSPATRLLELTIGVGTGGTGLILSAYLMGTGTWTSSSPFVVASGDSMQGFVFYETDEQAV